MGRSAKGGLRPPKVAKREKRSFQYGFGSQPNSPRRFTETAPRHRAELRCMQCVVASLLPRQAIRRVLVLRGLDSLAANGHRQPFTDFEAGRVPRREHRRHPVFPRRDNATNTGAEH